MDLKRFWAPDQFWTWEFLTWEFLAGEWQHANTIDSSSSSFRVIDMFSFSHSSCYVYLSKCMVRYSWWSTWWPYNGHVCSCWWLYFSTGPFLASFIKHHMIMLWRVGFLSFGLALRRNVQRFLQIPMNCLCIQVRIAFPLDQKLWFPVGDNSHSDHSEYSCTMATLKDPIDGQMDKWTFRTWTVVTSGLQVSWTGYQIQERAYIQTFVHIDNVPGSVKEEIK